MSIIRTSIILSLIALTLVGCKSTDEEPPLVAQPGTGIESGGGQPLVTDEEVPEQDLLDPNRIVARVNDEIITVRSIQAEFGDALLTIGEPTDARYRAALNQFAMEMIIGRLFLQAADRLGVTITKEDLDQLIRETEADLKKRDTTLDEDLRDRGIARWEWEEEQRKKLLIAKFYRMSMGQEQAISPETRPLVDFFVRPVEIRGYYERNIQQYHMDEQAKVAGIFVRHSDFERDGVGGMEAETAAKAYARLLLDRAEGGEPFDKLVEEVHGGPLDAFKNPIRRSDQQLDFVRNFVWNAKVGDISGPHYLPAGIVILKLEDYQKARVMPYEEAKEQITGQIRMLKFSVAQLKVQMQLLRESVVEPPVFKRELKLRFQMQSEQVLDELSI